MTNHTLTTASLELEGNLLKNAEFEQGFTYWVVDDKGNAANCTLSAPGVRLINQASIKQAVLVEPKATQYTFRLSAFIFNSSPETSKNLDGLGQVKIRENTVEVASFYLYSGAMTYEYVHTTQSTANQLEIEVSSGGSTPITCLNPSILNDFPDPDEFIKDVNFERPGIDWTGSGDWQYEGLQLTGNNSVRQLIRRLEPGSDYLVTYSLLPFKVNADQEEDIGVGSISGDGGFTYTDINPDQPVAPIPFTAIQNTLSLTLTGVRIRFGSVSLKKIR
jgi:hypothetical protein